MAHAQSVVGDPGGVPGIVPTLIPGLPDALPGLDRHIGLVLHVAGPDRVVLRLAVRPEVTQPVGIVHGGTYCAAIESAASVAASLWYGDRGRVVGVSNHTDFYRAVRSGELVVEALPVHRGRSQQVWRATITDADGRLVAAGQVRLQNLEVPASPGAPADG